MSKPSLVELVETSDVNLWGATLVGSPSGGEVNALEDGPAKRPDAVQVQLVGKVIAEQVVHSPAERVHPALRNPERRYDLIGGLITTLASTPVRERHARYSEVCDYVRQLPSALDAAWDRAENCTRGDPGWEA